MQGQRDLPSLLESIERATLPPRSSHALRHGQRRQGYLFPDRQDLSGPLVRLACGRRALAIGGTVHGVHPGTSRRPRHHQLSRPNYHSAVFWVSGLVLVGGGLFTEPKDEGLGQWAGGFHGHVCSDTGCVVCFVSPAGLSSSMLEFINLRKQIRFLPNVDNAFSNLYRSSLMGMTRAKGW